MIQVEHPQQTDLRSSMRTALVYELPSFDAGRFVAAEFLMSGGNAQLVIEVAEQSLIVLKFQRVRWLEFTALYNCSADQVQSAYFKLMRLDDSERLAKCVMADRATSKAYTQLHHFRIFLDEHGCHELFAQAIGVVE